MSKVWTYTEIEGKVRQDLDMEEELIIQDDEMLGYGNAAIEEAQAEILKIYEDYFMTWEMLTIAQGTTLYDLPSEIFIENIRGIVYINGQIIYPVRRIRGSNKFLQVAYGQSLSSSSDDYRYLLTNPSVDDGYKLNLVPPARETGAFLQVWYIRTAARFDDLSSKLDIPFAAQYIIEFMKGMCKAKENGGQMPADAAAMIEQKRVAMINVLTRMIPDDDDSFEQDLSHYEEMS